MGLPQIGLPRPLRKCFYCFKTDHLFLFCSKKAEDEKKGLILVYKFIVRFANRELILIEHNISIKNCIKKHLLSLIAVIIQEDPELETCSVWDQEPNIGEVVKLAQLARRQVEALSRLNGQLEELLQLRKKVGNLEVMIQKMNLEGELMPEPKEENIVSFLRRITVKYVQTKQDLALRKKLGFQNSQ